MSHERTFTYPQDATKFPRSTKQILELAQHLGWSMHWLGSNRLLVGITSPDKVKTITIPCTNLNHDRTRSTLTQIRRYSDAAEFDKWVEDKTSVKGSLRFTIPNTAEQVRPARPTPVPAHRTTLAAALDEAKRAAVKAAETIAEPVSRGSGQAAADDYVPADTHVVSETPWMVRKDGVDGGRGRMYESHVVLHRVWNNGTEDYRCKFCDYYNENPRSVSAHAAKSTDHPKREGPPEFREVPKYEETGIRHSDTNVRRLTSDLLHALDSVEGWQDMDREALARALAVAVHENRPDRAPAEPLTSEQIIERIVLMVDRGRLAEMHQQVEATAAAMRAMSEEQATLVAEATEARAEADRLREERKALAAMLSDVAS